MSDAIKWVVVEQGRMGRSFALRGLSFKSQAEAEQHINKKIAPRAQWRYHTESRIVKPDDADQRMTCQCCGGKYLAKVGTIAHHGYERPGTGWQTASCIGAKFVPFEKGHDRLDILIEMIAEKIKNMKVHVKATEQETNEVTVTISDFTRPRKAGFGQPTKTIGFTRKTFEEVTKHADHERGFRQLSGYYTFDDCKARQIEKTQRNIERSVAYRKDMQKRRAEWKHTHDYDATNKVWVQA